MATNKIAAQKAFRATMRAMIGIIISSWAMILIFSFFMLLDHPFEAGLILCTTPFLIFVINYLEFSSEA